jgi:hypothetical protein
MACQVPIDDPLASCDSAAATSASKASLIHWAVVDRRFDPECPDVIIRDRVRHSFCRCDTSVLSGSSIG